eukprot:1255019-Alexandrium_andersonii.AAC.1
MRKTPLFSRSRCVAILETHTTACLGFGAFAHPKLREIADVERHCGGPQPDRKAATLSQFSDERPAPPMSVDVTLPRCSLMAPSCLPA